MIFVIYDLRMQNNFAVKRRNLLLLTNAFIIKSIFPSDSINNVLVVIAIPVAGLWWET
jgi:hypothetical protein